MNVSRGFSLLCLVALASALRYQQQQRNFTVDPRTPEWMRDWVATQPWRSFPSMCAEGEHCKFTEADFWSPPNDTLTKAITDNFFAEKAPQFPFRVPLAATALNKRCLARRDASGSPRPAGLIQIGPNVLGAPEIMTHMAMSGACFNDAKLVLVEPQEPIMKDLTASAMAVGLGPERTKVINAAMCSTSGNNLTLYKFKDGSTNIHWLNDAITKWATLGGKDVLINTWKRNFQQMGIRDTKSSAELAKLIVGVDVPCHTPASLLRLTGMQASEVDFLFVDAEGYDAEILTLFDELPDFAPAAIIFEWAFHHASRGKLPLVVEVANFWSERGYWIFKDNDNLVMARVS